MDKQVIDVNVHIRCGVSQADRQISDLKQSEILRNWNRDHLNVRSGLLHSWVSLNPIFVFFLCQIFVTCAGVKKLFKAGTNLFLLYFVGVFNLTQITKFKPVAT